MFTNKPVYFTRSLPEGIINQVEVDITTQRILVEAEKLGVQWEILPDSDMIELSYRNNVQRFCGRSPNISTYEGIQSCRDKQLCKAVLKRAGLEVMPGFVINKEDADERVESIWNALQKPLVLKPVSGGHGRGIEVGLNNFSDCLDKVHQYFENPLYKGGLILEEMFFGTEYRIMVTQNKVLAIMERIPAHIIADGTHSIKELVEIENLNPLRNISQLLYPHITLNSCSLDLIKEQNFTLTSIPEKNKLIKLQKVSNIMAGGVAIDRTDEVHDSVKELALKAIKAIQGLAWTGIDFMTKDINAPQVKGGYAFIEMNSAPEFDMHDLPMQGKSREVTKEFIYLMFPELRS